MKIFWSWQSDHDATVCRDFVKQALQEAISRVTQELFLDESQRPILDHAIKDEAGMVDIADAILRKIEAATVFVADLTPIARSKRKKKIANPNVLLELGYALKALGPTYIISVVNLAFGPFKPEELPFDIRHRQGPITFNLSTNENNANKEAVRNQLIKELAARISACVKNSQKTKAEAANRAIIPEGVTSRASDPSVWFEQPNVLVHQDWHGGPQERRVRIPDGPRSYMRIIPSGWEQASPTRSEVHGGIGSAQFWPLGNWSDGSGGPNRDGVIRYGIHGQEENLTVALTVAQWFLKTGELWGVDCGVTFENKGAKIVANEYIIKRWRNFLKQGIFFLRGYRAKNPLRVEAGLVGISGTNWPGGVFGHGPIALDPIVREDRTSANWDETAQAQFITDLYNRLLEAFALTPVSVDAVKKLVGD